MKWVLGAILLLSFFGAGFAVLAEECVAAGEECYRECCVSLGYEWSGGGCTTPEEVDASELKAACAYCFDSYHECIALAEDVQEAPEGNESASETGETLEAQTTVKQEGGTYVDALDSQAHEEMEAVPPETPGGVCATGFVLLLSLIGISSCRPN